MGDVQVVQPEKARVINGLEYRVQYDRFYFKVIN
jgi:hypothetical protein